MSRTTQIQRVEQLMKKQGFCSRNHFLDIPTDKITRLSDIILKLRAKGLNITTETTERDTIYHLKPKHVEHFIIKETGERYSKNIY